MGCGGGGAKDARAGGNGLGEASPPGLSQYSKLSSTVSPLAVFAYFRLSTGARGTLCSKLFDLSSGGIIPFSKLKRGMTGAKGVPYSSDSTSLYEASAGRG